MHFAFAYLYFFEAKLDFFLLLLLMSRLSRYLSNSTNEIAARVFAQACIGVCTEAENDELCAEFPVLHEFRGTCFLD
jgi:hypothetical protein